MKQTKKILSASILISFTGLCGVALLLMVHNNKSTQPKNILPIAVNRVPGSTDERISTAQRSIEQNPSSVEGYNLLAAAFMRKARETNDFGFNARADAALRRAIEIDLENYDAIKLHAKLLLSYHRFTEALSEARKAEELRPDDHDNYGAITDALVELGDYEGAVEAAQKMVDLRPDSASYARVSYLRSLYGDQSGAIAAMRVAVKTANPNDSEAAAWCRVHLGDELMNAGKKQEAEREYDNALIIFPEYPLALAGKARARISAGDPQKAVELYERAQNRVPLPDNAIALGDLYAKLGRPLDAEKQYELVNFVERDTTAGNTYSRLLAMFWADHDERLPEALAIVERERANRQDIYTCDALAWILFKSNRVAEAKQAIDEALRLNTRDARLFFHAGMIYKASGESRKANDYLREALKINPNFDLLQSETARQSLLQLQTQQNRARAS
ncbi:MAG TPA: tetratricopeptide repeat protein [Pyrinomonadaceae bacterium]|nr:tetratricopeptide repeat protein [Pyrinomonadaceae bacterium]